MVAGGDKKIDAEHSPVAHDSDHGSTTPQLKKEFHHEIPPYAFKDARQLEKSSDAFWHPAPRDLPEAPVHFQKNVVHLELHLGDPRQRLAGMTDAERAWRKKFLDDQKLAPEEPVYIPEFLGNFNPFRRIYRWPWDTLERRVLIPALGYARGHHVRVMVPKFFITGGLVLWMYYHLKYFQPQWWDYKRTFAAAFPFTLRREEEIREKEPGALEKGLRHYKVKQDYNEFDFKNRWSHLQLDPPVRP